MATGGAVLNIHNVVHLSVLRPFRMNIFFLG